MTTEYVNAEDTIRIENLWHTCEQTGYLKYCYNQPHFKHLVGVFKDDTYTIKALCEKVESTFVTIIPPHKCFVFECDGEMPIAIDLTWKRFYAEWMPTVPYKCCELPQLEVYKQKSSGYGCEIWIPVNDESFSNISKK